MKKLFSLLMTALLFTTMLSAQENVTNEMGQQTLGMSEKPQRRAMAVYAELGGAGVNLLGLNFDTRLSKRPDGLGVRAGVSFFAFSDATLTTIPIGLNYLLGKRGKYFDVGLGVTAAFGSYRSHYSHYDNSNGMFLEESKKEIWKASRVTGTMTIGYRKQPIDGGFMFGVGVTPIFGSFDGKFYFWPYLPYVTLGYSF